MADRPARIRLMLQAGSFLGGMQQIAQKTRSVGLQLGRYLKQPVEAGLGAMKSSVASTVNTAKGLATAAAGIAGGFGVAAGIQHAIKIEDTYRDIAQAVSLASGEMVRWQTIQEAVEKAAYKHKRTSEELAVAFDVVRTTSGDAKVAMESLGLVAEVMNATGRSAEDLGAIVGSLRKKFGIKDQGELKQALLGVIEATKGGKLQKVADDLGELGSIAESSGLKGAEGFRKILGLATAMSPKVRDINEVMTGLDQLTEKLRQQPVVKGLAESGGLAGKKFFEEFLSQSDALGRLRFLLQQAAQKGTLAKVQREALEVEFTGREERAAFQILAEPFVKAYEKARESGEGAKKATGTALQAFDATVAGLGKTTSTWEDVQRVAAERTEGTAAKLRQAQDMWNQAFTDPKMMKAMGDLADMAPQVARGMADLLGFVTENPWTSGAAFVGGKAALAGGAAVVKTVVPKLSKSAFEGIGGIIAREAGAAGGPWKAAGKTLGKASAVAVGAAIAYELGKLGIDWLINRGEGSRRDVEQGAARGSAVAATGDIEEQKRALAAAKARRERMRKEGTDDLEQFFLGWVDYVPNIPGVHEIKGPRERFEEAWKKNEKTIAELEAGLKRTHERQKTGTGVGYRAEPEPESEKAPKKASRALEAVDEAGTASAGAMKQLKTDAESAARELRRIRLPEPGDGGGGSNGLPPPAPNRPGYTEG